VTTADLKDDGTTPELKDELTISVITGSDSSRQFLRSQVGIGSREEDLDGALEINFLNSDCGRGWKSVSDVEL
jgi:hypothetical protein